MYSFMKLAIFDIAYVIMSPHTDFLGTYLTCYSVILDSIKDCLQILILMQISFQMIFAMN